MIADILLTYSPRSSAIIFFLIYVMIVLGIPALLVFFFIRFVRQTNRERRRLRLEVGKIADELEQLKKQANAENQA